MAKKNYKKYLPKVGGTVAVALAMTVALSAQAQAADLGELEPLVDDPAMGSETGDDLKGSVLEPNEVNEEIAQSNEEVAADNQDTVENNEQIEQDNNDTADENEELTGGELENPDLELPEVPDMPDTDDLDAEDYNDVVGDYNEGVDDYNQGVDDYNQSVDDYNGAAEEAEKQAQADYLNSQAYQEYLVAKTEWEAKDKAYRDYLANNEDYKNSQAYQEYLAAKAEWDIKDKAYRDSLQAQSDYLNSQDYQDYLAAKAEWEAKDKAYQDYLANNEDYKNTQAYQDYLAAKTEWEAKDKAYRDYLANNEDYKNSQAYQDYLKEKAEYDQLTEENEIFDEVTEYNKGVEADNAEVEKQNGALENDVDGNADDISKVGEANRKLELEAGVEDALNTYEDLVKEQAELEAQAKALDEHGGKNAALGSSEYAAYLAQVEAYNNAVAAYNGKIDSYNAAVAKYNAAVDAYNEKQQNTNQTVTDEAQGTGTADWGNFKDEDLSFNHLDVRYHAAVVKVKEEVNGQEVYKDAYNRFDVVGVYYNEDAKKEDSEEYGITYTNTKGEEVKYEMVKDNDHHEFATASKDRWGQIDRTDADADKDTVVTFYATLNDGSGITIRLDKNSTYAENSYFRYDAADHLDDFVDSDGNKLKIVTIGDEKYYDISGQPVFLISALTCDGYGMHSFGYGGNTELGGLDLVLNMETIIKIYQADKAQTVSYLEKKTGKTAQAEAPEEPGTAPEAPVVAEPEPKPEAPVVTDPGEAPENKMPGLEPDPGPAPGAPVVADPGLEPTAPEAPAPLGRLDHAEKLEKLEEKVIIDIVDPVDPGDPMDPIIPDPIDPVIPGNDFTEIVDEEVPLTGQPELVEILDEDVPLAAAPKTGDASAVFGAMSGFSALGMAVLHLLGRKKRNEK